MAAPTAVVGAKPTIPGSGHISTFLDCSDGFYDFVSEALPTQNEWKGAQSLFEGAASRSMRDSPRSLVSGTVPRSGVIARDEHDGEKSTDVDAVTTRSTFPH